MRGSHPACADSCAKQFVPLARATGSDRRTTATRIRRAARAAAAASSRTAPASRCCAPSAPRARARRAGRPATCRPSRRSRSRRRRRRWPSRRGRWTRRTASRRSCGRRRSRSAPRRSAATRSRRRGGEAGRSASGGRHRASGSRIPVERREPRRAGGRRGEAAGQIESGKAKRRIIARTGGSALPAFWPRARQRVQRGTDDADDPPVGQHRRARAIGRSRSPATFQSRTAHSKRPQPRSRAMPARAFSSACAHPRRRYAGLTKRSSSHRPATAEKRREIVEIQRECGRLATKPRQKHFCPRIRPKSAACTSASLATNRCASFS